MSSRECVIKIMIASVKIYFKTKVQIHKKNKIVLQFKYFASRTAQMTIIDGPVYIQKGLVDAIKI